MWPFWPTVAVLLLVTIFGCEVLPKKLAVRRPELRAMRVAPPMRFFQAVTLPLRWLAQKLDGSIVRLLVPKSIKPQIVLTGADCQELIELAAQ